MWMAALKFESSEMLRRKVWMAKRRDQEFFNFMCRNVHLCDSECLLCVRDVVCVCV